MNTLPAGYKMSAKANGAEYVNFIRAGWPEKEIIERGYIELIHPKKTVADVWKYFKGVWPDSSNFMYWDSSDPFTQSDAICNREQFEQYGRNRKVQINGFIKTNAELTQCNADLVSTNENIILRNRALNNQNHQLKLKQSSLEKALDNVKGDNDAAHIELKQTIAELISDKEVDRNEINIHKEMVKKQGEIIQRLNTSNEKDSEESNHLRLNLRDLHLSDSEKTMRIREQAIELREQAIEIRELKEELNSFWTAKEPKNDD